MPKISKPLVDATVPDATRRFYVWDDQMKGFGLLVLPSGVKSYIFQYRAADGKERRATLGKHGAITADEARGKADEMRRSVVAGGDPLAEKHQRRKAAKIGDILDAYLASQTFLAKADSTRATDKGRIERHLRPLLGTVAAEALKQSDAERAFAAIRDGKTAVREKMGKRALARVRGGDGAARKSIRLLRAIMSWAVRERRVAANPLLELSTGTDGQRDTILDDAEAYRRLFQTLDAMEADKSIRRPVADAIRVIALTGARRGEVAGMRWRHVDLKAGLVAPPPAAHKTGRRTGKPRVIGLPAAAQALIARQEKGAADDYVFAPARGDGPVVLSKPWGKIHKRAGLPAGLGMHGLRHSLASHMAMAGAQASEIMTVMGHRSLATSQKYIHWASDARQAVAERAASVALAGMNAEAGKPSAEIVPLKS